MYPNPYDPLKRTDLTANEKAVLHFTDQCLHHQNEDLIERYIAEDYIQHTNGIGQGREGLREYLKEVAWKRPRGRDWRPIHIFAVGDFVILHKLLPLVVIADFFRIRADGLFAEHWDVVQPLPEPDFDPMKISSRDFSRFRVLFDIKD
jgi:predicted SnoaL-like aldol condensation-catalyzing enzyme